jgi:hypothetical protein
MRLSNEQHLDALIQITAALIVRSQSLSNTADAEFVNDPEDWLNETIRRVESAPQ